MHASPRLLIGAWALAALGGCTDTKGAFDDFEQRVIDASVVEADSGGEFDQLPDISGRFYISVEPSQALGEFLHLVWDNELVIAADETGTLTITQSFLSNPPPGNETPRLVVGSPTIISDIAVNRRGEMGFEYVNLTLEGQANPISGSSYPVNATLVVRIVDENGLCGEITDGMAGPLPLAGTKLVGRRVPAGTVGDALPAPTSDCNALTTPAADAGPVGSDAGAAQ